MDRASDSFGTDKRESTSTPSNGFVFPRDSEQVVHAPDLPRREAAPRDHGDVPAREPASGRGERSTDTDRPRTRPTPVASTPNNSAAPAGTLPSGLPVRPTKGSSEQQSWFQTQGGSPTEHPLMAGLLLELPPRDGPVDKVWLENWLQAARAILELIYTRSTNPGTLG